MFSLLSHSSQKQSIWEASTLSSLGISGFFSSVVRGLLMNAALSKPIVQANLGKIICGLHQVIEVIKGYARLIRLLYNKNATIWLYEPFHAHLRQMGGCALPCFFLKHVINVIPQRTATNSRSCSSLLSIPGAIPSADQVRITPSLRSQRGSVWTKNRVNFEHWEAEVTFRVSGRGRMGADGLVSGRQVCCATLFTNEHLMTVSLLRPR